MVKASRHIKNPDDHDDDDDKDVDKMVSLSGRVTLLSTQLYPEYTIVHKQYLHNSN